MTLQIGQNIRRLRTERDMTQDQLANLLNVSSAAVSKWESGASLPDITMVMPLAKVFEISTDELMGFDAAMAEAEVDEILREHRRLDVAGFYKEATELITKARADYPADYRIMNRYMWEIAGGSADNDPAVLLAHEKEFTEICDCIEDSCRDPHLQYEALTMRAKLLHAAGETDKAVELLQQLPAPYQTADYKTEQLFAKDTPEFRSWNRHNAYVLADGLLSKIIRMVWYQESVDEQERIRKAEAIGDLFSEMRQRCDEPVFAVMEHMSYAMLVNHITGAHGNIDDIIRVTEKLLVACDAMTKAAATDEVLGELLQKTYGTTDILTWTINDRKSGQLLCKTRLHESGAFMAMLARFERTV